MTVGDELGKYVLKVILGCWSLWLREIFYFC